MLETWVDSQSSRGFHFTHVLIDEAAQATFSESLNAIMFPYVYKNEAQLPRLLLAGDPLQLGPALNSTIAQRMLLAKPLLEVLNNEHINNYDLGTVYMQGSLCSFLVDSDQLAVFTNAYVSCSFLYSRL